MKKILIWDSMISGHHIEYIHHIFELAKRDQNNQYIFSIQKNYSLIEKSLKWDKTSNIFFDFINAKQNQTLYERNKSIKEKIANNKADCLILINILDALPFLPFMMLFAGIKTKISGILYDIYLYKWKTCSVAKKIRCLFIFGIFKFSKCFQKIWVLNDNASALILNRIWKTNRFDFIPDPIPIQTEQIKPEMDNNTHGQRQIILHYGSLSRRKGTLNIIKAANLIENDKDSREYVFLGKIQPDIQTEFDEEVRKAEKNHLIRVKNVFCSFEEIVQTIKQTDYLILPYQETSKSSGVVGYAAYLKKNVVVPNSGLLGKVVRKYRLGIRADIDTPEGIADFIKNNKTISVCLDDEYLNTHRVSDFQHVIEKTTKNY